MWKNIFLFVIATLLFFHAPIDPDFGWHFKYGEYIFKNHTLLKTNEFSYTFPQYEWANSYWLAEITLYLLYTYFGAIGMSLILSAILSAILVAFLRAAGIGTFGKFTVGLAVIFFIGAAYTSVRPFYFSTIFLLLLSYILLYKKSWQIALPIIFALWANMHADFVLGLFIYGAFTINELIETRFKKPAVVLMPILSVVSTLLNPYGYKLWLTLFKETHYYQFNYILEWEPLNLAAQQISTRLSSAIALVLGAFIFASVVAAHLLDKKLFKLWYVLITILFFMFSLRAVYFIRILALLSLFPGSFFINFVANFIKGSLHINVPKQIKYGSLLLPLLGILICAEVFLRNLVLAGNFNAWTKDKNYPVEAIEYIKDSKLAGNMFNPYNWGGFLIWQLPEYKTFIDGRMPSWRENSESVFEDYINITSKPKENMEIFYKYVDKYQIGFVLDIPEAELVKELRNSDQWGVAHETENYIILTKK